LSSVSGSPVGARPGGGGTVPGGGHAERHRCACEHTDTYNALRQSQEGLHGFAKDEGKEALGSSGKRRAFLNRAVEDASGDLYVTRNERAGDHARTHLPPGTKGTRGDPAYDENVETARDEQGAA
jgi:hypothetical protein